MDVFVPAIPMMGRFFQTDDTVMQASLYVFMLTVAFGQLIVGPLADKIGRRRITLGAALLFFIGSMLSALAPSISTLIIARIIQALGACGTYLLCFIIVRDNFSTIACGRLFSILCGINAMVASTAPVIGGILVDRSHDWHTVFYFLMLLGLFMFVIAYKSIPDYIYPKQEASHSTGLNTAKLILSNLNFRKYAMNASVCLLGLYLFCAMSPGILISQLGLSPTAYGMWFGLNALTVFVSNIIASRLTFHYPLEKLVHWGMAWIVLSCLMMISLTFYQASILHFMLPMLSITFGIGLTMGLAAALALKDFQQQAGTATAFLGACQYGISGLIGVLTAQWTPHPSILAVSMICLSMLTFIKLKKAGVTIGASISDHSL